MEERTLAKENLRRQNTDRARNRERVQSALERVRRAAEEDRGRRFTTLLHHVYAVDTLREAYWSLKRKASPGVDGVTWQEYGEGLEERLQDLSGRLQRGAYRARPVKRSYIPKPDGRQRPLGITTVEDKVVQTAMTMVLNQVYEVDFMGFSYGFRPGRSQHDALDALCVGIERRRVRWVLDADIRGFFDAIDHERMIELVECRIADRRVTRLIRKWLKAGVLEEEKRMRAKLAEIKRELRRRINDPIPTVGGWLRSVVEGHMRYYGVPLNIRALSSFRWSIAWLWKRTLNLRSHKAYVTWNRMQQYIDCWLPKPRICHPYPIHRLTVRIQGKSPVR